MCFKIVALVLGIDAMAWAGGYFEGVTGADSSFYWAFRVNVVQWDGTRCRGLNRSPVMFYLLLGHVLIYLEDAYFTICRSCVVW